MYTRYKTRWQMFEFQRQPSFSKSVVFHDSLQFVLSPTKEKQRIQKYVILSKIELTADNKMCTKLYRCWWFCIFYFLGTFRIPLMKRVLACFGNKSIKADLRLWSRHGTQHKWLLQSICLVYVETHIYIKTHLYIKLNVFDCELQFYTTNWND